jgi:hypothetical protein
MKKKFIPDSDISDQINKSLENHEEEYIEGSWENFLQKRKMNDRRLFWLIASGVAACLMIGFACLNYMHFDKKNLQNSVVQQNVPNAGTNPAIETKSPEKSSVLIATMKSGNKQPLSERTIVKSIPIPKANTMAEGFQKTEENQQTPVSAADSAKKFSLLASGATQQTNNTKADSVKNISDSVKKKPSDTFLNVPAQQENKELASASGRKIRFGINFSPGVNSAQTSGSLDYTGGVSADITLSSKFLLSTGLQVQNSHVDQKIAGIVSSSSAPQDETKSKLINLDVPLNIIWKFFSVKSNSWYVSAGVSSLVYLNQQDANTKYSNLLVPVSLKVGGSDVKTYDIVSQVSVTQNTVAPSQTFDFAGRINLMVGFETKLSDRMLLHFEPYAKIPSPGQTSGSLNKTTTGINFKVSF